ncbi:penicillin-binding transpeptidase domain-containing protein [Actinomadura viridis]|uniref:penicillin-binding transpeptidase domain-containing protein n=1 Tax=Actinomadura viridis TaxID=58110 RepID=UPI00367883B1
MTPGPGRGAAGPPPGRRRGSAGRPSRDPSGGDDKKSGPGAARASGRKKGDPPRSPGGAGSPRRPARNGMVPPPRSGSGGSGGSGKKAGGKGAPAKPSAPKPSAPKGATGTSKTPASKTPASKTPASKTPASKTPASKTPASRGSASKAPAAKGSAKAAPRRTSASRTPAKPPARTSAARTSANRSEGRPPPRRRTAPGGGSGGGRGGGNQGRPPRPRVPFHRRDPVKRLNVGLLVVAFVLSLFAGRLVQLQTIESGSYSELAMKQRLQTIDLPAVRGDITDAQGNPLAMTVEARAIFADPFMIKPEKRQGIVNALAPTLGLDPARVMKIISTPDSRFEYLAHGVRPDQARLVMGYKFLGIGTLPEYRRQYPNDSLAAGVIGFVNAEGRGAAGLEYSMNRQLAGSNGWQRVEISPEGQHIPMGEDQKRPPVPGRGVRLTLMRDLQFQAQRAIERQVQATGARSGSVIVMDPRDGRLLALASAPGYDPNDYGKSAVGLWNSPIVHEEYEPGSTGKVVTAAAVLEKGGVRPDTPFTVPDRVKRHDRTFRDSHPHPTQRLTFAGVLATSSNVGTILASEQIQAPTLYQSLRDFGFGERTGVGLPAETPGKLQPPAKWSGTDRYAIAFGQSMTVNALQMASVYATIANGGIRVAPTLVAGTTDDDGTFTAAAKPESRQVISGETARQIRDMLEGVASPEGTAPKARIPGYRVAGKTGTAEIVNPRCGCYDGSGYTASFAGFAPADDPQLVVQVVLQRPKKGSHYGGDAAAPVFKDVMGFALQSRKIPPTGSKPPITKIHARD